MVTGQPPGLLNCDSHIGLPNPRAHAEQCGAQRRLGRTASMSLVELVKQRWFGPGSKASHLGRLEGAEIGQPRRDDEPLPGWLHIPEAEQVVGGGGISQKF